MLAIEPWADLFHNGAGLAKLREAVSGEVLRAVHYVALRGHGWPEGHRDDRAHEVDMAVELGMESGAVLVLAWAMDGLNEGIATEFRCPGEPGTGSLGDPVDVSDHVDWRRFLGVPIANIGVAWHVPNVGCREMPWAYRFGFSNESSLVIALGESEGAGFAYSPDGLVVIFDDEIASAYTIPASRTSASG